MLLSVRDLSVEFGDAARRWRVVDGIGFELRAGETLGMAGESGCGKSLTALALMRLLPPGARLSGRIQLEGRDIVCLSDPAMRAIRGRRIAMVFQEPMSALNPVLTVGVQIAESIRDGAARRRPRGTIRGRVVELLGRVGIPDPESRVDAYPHELSGGMRQRVVIAIALAGEPALLIADEPTTALDVSVQAQILDLLRSLQRQSGMAMLLITHDLGVAATMASEIAVMYAGRIVERGPASAIVQRPLHPYAQALLECSAAVALDARASRSEPLPTVAGAMPVAGERAVGCAFQPRCALGDGDSVCRSQVPMLQEVASGRRCACWKAPGFVMES